MNRKGVAAIARAPQRLERCRTVSSARALLPKIAKYNEYSSKHDLRNPNAQHWENVQSAARSRCGGARLGAGVELKRGPVERFAVGTRFQQREFGVAECGVGSLSLFETAVEFIHELGSGDVADFP